MKTRRMKDFQRWVYEAVTTTPEERIREEVRRVREWEECEAEQERARREKRRRRALAKIGLTPEEFEERVQEFRRKFPIG